MLKKIGLIAVMAAAGGISPAMAQATCAAPVAPVSVDGTKVTIDQLRAAIADAKAFIAASDTYQDCENASIKTQKDQAVADKKPFDSAIQQAAAARMSTNQAQKEKVGNDINAAIGAYKKAHPG